MKVLIINQSIYDGGAARAAHRLFTGLVNRNVDVTFLSLDRKVNQDKELTFFSSFKRDLRKVGPKIESVFINRYRNKFKSSFSISRFNILNTAKVINEMNPDIVHLHWINSGTLTIKEISQIKAPIVWSLHDMWPFTGGCHYDLDCGLYKKECGTCKVLNSNKLNDLSKKLLSNKQKWFSQIDNLTIVALSSWLEGCAKSSSLFRNKRIVRLPNPIDVSVFDKVDKYVAREILTLPRDKKLLLFGAMYATSDPRKGFNELINALSYLDKNKYEVVIFGASHYSNKTDIPLNLHLVGQLNDDISLKLIYSAVDLTIVPSLQENLSNVIMESLSCATPVVAFNIGGNSDLIEHKVNGFLAKPYKSNELAKGVDWIIEGNNNEEIKKNSRMKVLENFSEDVLIPQYIELYRSILNHS